MRWENFVMFIENYENIKLGEDNMLNNFSNILAHNS